MPTLRSGSTWSGQGGYGGSDGTRGYGGSDCPPNVEDYGIRDLAADIDGLATALGYDEYCLMIHDWGAIAGHHVALLYPDRVRAVPGFGLLADIGKCLALGAADVGNLDHCARMGLGIEIGKPALLAADVHFLVVGHLEVCAAGQQLQQRLHEHQHEEEHEEKERQQQQQQQDVHVVYRCSSCTQVSFEPAAWP